MSYVAWLERAARGVASQNKQLGSSAQREALHPIISSGGLERAARGVASHYLK
jgi:hypothetical protein